mgnify:CR=1 FL=1
MPNFTCKEEAIAFYREEEPSLSGMPDYLIGVLIDFSKKYDNYDEYLSVEAKVQSGKTLTKKEQKKYGHLTFDKVHVTHPKNAVIHEHITTQDEGTFDNLGTKEGFDKYNKFGLNYSELEEPLENIKFQFKDESTGDTVIVEKPIKDIREDPANIYNGETWDVKHTETKKLEE